MVVYNWWCHVDFHFWTLCKLLCCNADGWNMQTYFQYLDKEATAIGIGKVDESAKLASRTRVKPLLAVQKERWNRCNSQHLTSFTSHRIAHQINDNFRVLRTLHGTDLLATQRKEWNASFGRRPLSTATEHEHAISEHYYRVCIIEYFFCKVCIGSKYWTSAIEHGLCSLMHFLDVSKQLCYRAGCNVSVLLILKAYM